MKTIYMIYCALIALAAFSAPVSADIVGDANNDNRITAADSVLALQMSVGSIAPDLERADVSGDGRISSLDALMILRMAQKTQVCVNAPETVSDAFNVTIDIYNVADLDSGQFDLSFDSSVVNVTAVGNGDIDGTTVPIDSWNFTDADTIRVLFNLPGAGATGISGSGQIATISFEITGAVKDTSVMDISDGLLVDTESNKTSAIWFDADVAIGVPVKVNAPEVATGAFDATIDVEDIASMNGGQFDLSFDSSVVNVTDVSAGEIGGTAVPLVDWRFMDADTIRVIFKLSGADGVSGSGYVAKIDFALTGSQGDSCVLDISDGLLADTGADEIPATWRDADVAIGVPVTVDAPDVATGAFDATIDVEDIASMNGGQFDLSFDPSVVNVTGVSAGEIAGTAVPLVDWRFMDADTIRVIFKLSGADGVSGSGYVAKIDFALTGSQGDSCVLDISDGLLADTGADEIPATWTDANVAIGVPVTVDAPDVATGAFDATIDVEDIASMNGGQFDLSFDPSVVNVTGVSAGEIAGTAVPLVDWRFMDADTIRVIFKLSGADGVSGSGYVAKIDFALTGSQGDSCVLDISDGLLADTGADEIPATWTDADVAIGVSVRVNAPEVASGAFDATIDIENVVDMNGGQFDLSFDSSVVNVIDVNAGNIDGTTVPLVDWRFMDSDTIRVLFKLSGDNGVSGSGYVTKIGFEITGSDGDVSVLDISAGLLADIEADGIPATWTDDEVTV